MSDLPTGLLRMTTAPLALPSGMRDLLPPRSHARRHVARTVLTHFERYGYQLVVPPAFEREDVVTLGLSERARRDVVRFLEPETGDVMVLRPDMTPQIARIAATRYRDAVGPLRFMYEGSVIRRPRGRARRHRQVSQAGIECIGWHDPAADVEVIRAAAGALTAAGLTRWRIELGHAAIADELLREVPPEIRDVVTDALSARDTATLARLLGATFHARSAMAAAIDLAGDTSVLDRADQTLQGPAFAGALASLRTLLEGLSVHGLADRCLVDLGEIRGHGYYTGVSFQILAEGPGEPVASGGRYDTLLARFGRSLPATGCALDLEHVEWALGAQGAPSGRGPHRVLVGGAPAQRALEAERLRGEGVAVAECSATSEAELATIAKGADFDDVVWCTEG